MNKIEQALIDPEWEWGVLSVDDARLHFLTLHHPVYGSIHCVLAKDTMQKLGEWLKETGT
jgi:hypothetical protein